MNTLCMKRWARRAAERAAAAAPHGATAGGGPHRLHLIARLWQPPPPCRHLRRTRCAVRPGWRALPLKLALRPLPLLLHLCSQVRAAQKMWREAMEQ